MELAEFLTWFVAQGGAPMAAYWLVDRIPWSESAPGEWRRYAALALTGLIAAVGYLAQVAMGYSPMPTEARGWIEALFYVGAGGIAMVTNQVIHARLDLNQPKARAGQ
jgi:hypothetical protein